MLRLSCRLRSRGAGALLLLLETESVPFCPLHETSVRLRNNQRRNENKKRAGRDSVLVHPAREVLFREVPAISRRLLVLFHTLEVPDHVVLALAWAETDRQGHPRRDKRGSTRRADSPS